MNKDILLTDRWFKIPPHVLIHPVQVRLKNSKVQFNVIAAGRRSFKTERLKRRFVWKYAFNDGEPLNAFLGGPTRTQAKMIFWDDIKKLSPKWSYYSKDIRESELSIKYKNGSKITVVGLEEYERVEGTRWNDVGITEYQKVNPDFFASTLQPILNDVKGSQAFLEGRPLGKNHFYDAFLREKEQPDRWASYTWRSSEVLSAEQIKSAKNDLALEDYLREYDASFETAGQKAYYAYTIKNHKVRGTDWKYTNSSWIVCCDFNAQEKPMSWTVGQEQGNSTYFGKSLSYTYTNTEGMCKVLWEYFLDLQKHDVPIPKMVNFYGDYSGSKHTSNSSVSDWQIIEQFFRNKFVVEKHLKPNPEQRDRVAATNARFLNANGEMRAFIDPIECKALIRDLDRMQWKPNGVDLNDKDPRDGHNSDSIDYYFHYKWPIKGQVYSKQY